LRIAAQIAVSAVMWSVPAPKAKLMAPGTGISPSLRPPSSRIRTPSGVDT
jgi:hypothetical protein